MSITITITVPDDLPASTSRQAYLATCMAAIGYAPMVRATGVVPALGAPYAASVAERWNDEISQKIREGSIKNDKGADGPVSGDIVQTSDNLEAAEREVLQAEKGTGDAPLPDAKPKRERGKPDPASGRSRRTKEEIAEDAAADAADAARAASGGNISTNPEDRQPPADEEEDGTVNQAVDSAEVDAQDEADEAAEQARLNAAKPAGTLTIDDLRRAMGEVGKKHGIALAAKLPGFFGAFAQIEESCYADVIAEMQALVHLPKEDVEAFLSTGTEEKAAAPETIKIPPGTRQQLVQAMFRYAEFADGTRDQDKMKFTLQDLPIVFKEAFGVEAQLDIPEERLGEAIKLVDETIAKDRFKRKRG